MMGLLHITRLLPALAALAFAAPATSADLPTRYDPAEAFAPFQMADAPNLIRTSSGVPGPAFWQNRADYTIRAALDPATHVIRGTVDIRYTNNSPDRLDVLWLTLEQNRYRPDSRGVLSSGAPAGGFTDGMVLDSASVQVGRSSNAVQPLISDTRAQIRLPV